jgi:radical SAM protein with 4Fe4S-binding SPASM domain
MDILKHPLHIESIDLEITSKCNLLCSYCYIKCGKYPMGDMSDETIELTLDLIEKYGVPQPTTGKTCDGKTRNVRATAIAFYGGEPMLSFERMEYFILRSIKRNMKLKFSALSNGTTGTQEQVNFLRYFNIWTQRSIDGCPEAQEKYRPNSIELYKEKNKIWKDYDHSRRMTVQPEFAKDLLKSQLFFEEMGFWKGISPMPNYYTEWSDEHIEDFKKSLWDIGRHYIIRWKEGKAFYNYYLTREMVARFLSQQSFGCGGGRGLHCVSWDGWLYMCHRFSKEPHDSPFCYGYIKDVLDGTAKGYDEIVYDRTAQYQRNTRNEWEEECKTCIGNGNCEKGCMHTNWLTTHTTNKPPPLYCEIRKEASKVVTWLDEQLRPLNLEWWKQGNTLVRSNPICNQQIQSNQPCGVDAWQVFSDGTRRRMEK